jgi:hypothetical protein
MRKRNGERVTPAHGFFTPSNRIGTFGATLPARGTTVRGKQGSLKEQAG